MTADSHDGSEPQPETIAAIGLLLLLEHHESAGPYGRIRYVHREDGLPAAESPIETQPGATDE